MKIPKEFKIFGQTIKVEYTNGLIQENDNTGEARFRFNKIVLQRNCQGFLLSQTQLEQIFLHELIHIVLYELREDELYKNDSLVDRIASAIHQVFQTAKY